MKHAPQAVAGITTIYIHKKEKKLYTFIVCVKVAKSVKPCNETGFLIKNSRSCIG